MSTAGTIALISNRLTTVQSQLLERSRVLSLGMVPSSSSSHSLVRSLTQIKSDLVKLEDEAELELAGLIVGGGSGSRRSSSGMVDTAAIGDLGDRYDRLIEMLQGDADGRERAKPLVREKRSPSPATEEDDEAHAEVPDVTVEPPTPAPDAQALRPFRDYDDDDDDEPEQSPHEMLQQQDHVMREQDERLTLLSHSINRQNHLSVQIGDELDVHHELLEETDAAMDRTTARLGRARRQLDHVADNAKQHGSTITIVALILILLLLIIVFKT